MRYLPLFLAVFCSTCSCASTPRTQEVASAIPYMQSGYYPSGLTRDETLEIKIASFVGMLKAVLDVTVEFSDDEAASLGGGAYFQPLRKIIIVKSANPLQRMELLCHEAAHVLQPNGLSQVEYQAWAELVGVEVCTQWGVPETREQSARYLSGIKSGLVLIENHALDMNWAISVLSGRPVRAY